MPDIYRKYENDSSGLYKVALFLWSLSALLCGMYFLTAMARSGVAFEQLSSLPKLLILLWKGAAEVLLVIAVCLTAKSHLARKLVFTVVLIVVADIFLAIGMLPLAGGLFILAHFLAMLIYLRLAPNADVKFRLKLLSLMPLGLVFMLLLWSLQVDKFQMLVVFPIFSALAAFGALRSTYPLLSNGLGYVIFWLSDMIFVVAILFWGDATLVGWLVWLSFSSGLLLIVRGLLFRASSKAAIELNS